MRSLKTKFITTITLLIVIVVTVTSGVLIQQKRAELQEDIYTTARSFAELATPKIIELSQNYLPEQNFIFFQRDLNSLLKNNPDLGDIQIFDFNGKIIFDSQQESNRQYLGPDRQLTDLRLLQRVKAANTSVLNQDDQIFYIEKISAGNYEVINQANQRLSHRENLSNFRNLQNLVHPIAGEYAIKYEITYQNLNKRLFAAAIQIALIGLFSILASIFIGYILSAIVTKPIRKLTDVVELIAKGDFSKRADIKSNDEVGILADSVNHMAEDLEKATEAKIYQEKTKKELEIAAKIQKELLPTVIPTIEGLDIAAEVIPATEIGGDVYDILLDKEQIPYFYVGDVTGHGVPAGLLSSVTNAIITSTVDLADPIKIVDNLNHTLKQKSAGNLFITLLLARYANSCIEYVSAGHEKSLFYNASTKKAEYLKPGGIALGLFDNIADKLEQQTVCLNQNDLFILYTDGIPEAWRSETEQYGEEKLLALTEQAVTNYSTAQEIKDFMLSEVKNFMGDYEQQDDITLIIIKKT
jgi:serine phosphatase RsbU (regulator of sigma subunit)